MNIPHYINENKSDMRGIKPGWYMMRHARRPNIWLADFQTRKKGCQGYRGKSSACERSADSCGTNTQTMNAGQHRMPAKALRLPRKPHANCAGHDW
jgi:hypothetical protein